MKLLANMHGKINIKMLREAAKKKGIRSISELARKARCSREAVYFAIERPSRYPRVFATLRRLTDL